MDGSLDRYKAILVAKGYIQIYGVELPRDFRTSSQDEHCESFTLFGYSIWLRLTTVWCEKCIPIWRAQRGNLYGSSI